MVKKTSKKQRVYIGVVEELKNLIEYHHNMLVSEYGTYDKAISYESQYIKDNLNILKDILKKYSDKEGNVILYSTPEVYMVTDTIRHKVEANKAVHESIRRNMLKNR